MCLVHLNDTALSDKVHKEIFAHSLLFSTEASALRRVLSQALNAQGQLILYMYNVNREGPCFHKGKRR